MSGPDSRRLVVLFAIVAIAFVVLVDPHAALAAGSGVDRNSDAYKSGRLAAYITMGAIALYFVVRWLRNRDR